MSNRSNRHPLRRCEGRLDRVGQVLQQWRNGLPLRTAAKVLRKVGIHPWSLAVSGDQDDWERLVKELHVPAFFCEAIRRAMGFGVHFLRLQGPLRLPEGLVVSNFYLVGCPEVLRLPPRLWACRLSAAECARLDRLSLGRGDVERSRSAAGDDRIGRPVEKDG